MLVEAPHIVEAEDVIGVAVGEENRVDAAHVVRERLRAQIGRRVDEDRADRRGRCRPASRPSSSIRIDGRVRRSRGSVDRQTAQSQPIAGTPCDVPLPSTVTRIYGSMIRLCRVPPLSPRRSAGAARRAPARAPAALRPSGCRASSARAATRISIICAAPSRFGSPRSPVAGSGRSPKWIAAVLASETTNAVNVRAPVRTSD